jgi:hypothetical protein
MIKLLQDNMEEKKKKCEKTKKKKEISTQGIEEIDKVVHN